MTIKELSSTEARLLLQRITGQEFTYSNERPEDALFTLRDYNISSVQSLCIEFCVKSQSGILVISEPLTRMSYWQIPEDIDLGDLAKDEAMSNLLDEYNTYLQAIYQAVYLINSQYSTNIKMAGEDGDKQSYAEPRLFIFLHNNQSIESFAKSVSALDQLLPKLELSA